MRHLVAHFVSIAALGGCGDNAGTDDTCPPPHIQQGTGDTSEPPALATDFSDVSPFVILSTPRSGDGAVDPSLDRLTATFSQDMQPDSYSFVGDPERAPETTGAPEWVDSRTVTLGVSLEPSRTYEIWLNSCGYSGFLSLGGESAAPFALIFRTSE